MTKRVRATIRGRVQGVGFRPTVYRYAKEAGLAGFVRNAPAGVVVELEGPAERIEGFFARLEKAPPPQARIDSVEREEIPPGDETDFQIAPTAHSGDLLVGLPPDLATCPDCLAELRDPADRRFGYPFTNCTNCGPRFTIVRSLPYDRPRTSMAPFQMCEACRAEYESPEDRRFDAQPNACAACGPRLRLVDPAGHALDGDPIEEAAEALRAGRIVAVKGLGGFHLAVDATSEEPVARLRERKRRPSKALAVMFASLEELRGSCRFGPEEEAMLLSPRRPIVVLPRRPGAPLAAGISPDTRDVGAFLPYTPLHALLLEKVSPLVMTSGNLAEEPIARTDEELAPLLGPVADFALTHDREIVRRCDDSVMKLAGGRPLPYRRSRGWVPDAVRLPVDGAPVIACGGEMKNTFCVTRGDRALVSQHIGELSDLPAFRFFAENVRDFCALLQVEPRVVAHDLHPDYVSTRWALDSGLRTVAVQHHHAHAASVMVEHGLTGPVLGVSLDGTGYGPDGTVWGGEFLACDLAGYERFARLGHYPLPGGEETVRRPVRMALACLLSDPETARDEVVEAVLGRMPAAERRVVARMIERGFRTPLTSSAGRLFDAVSALLGLCDEIDYEGQAAVRLQWAAADGVDGAYEFALEDDGSGPLVLDFSPTIRGIVRDIRSGAEAGRIAAMFHNTLAAGVRAVCLEARARKNLETVTLSGGCFQNERLLGLVTDGLASDGFEVCSHERVPPNDAGICLGQAAVALALARKIGDNVGPGGR
jgi:hydrogenase maturation protein HypF